MPQCVKLLLATLFVPLVASSVLAVCTPPAPSTAANYQKQLTAWVGQQPPCFLTEWKSDVKPHLSGTTVNGTTYSVHDQIRV